MLRPAIEVFGRPTYHLASEVLEAARKILRKEGRWIQNTLAVGPEGEELTASEHTPLCDTTAKAATAFCALGAVKFVNGPAERSATAFLIRAAYKIEHDEELADELVKRPGSVDHIFTINDEYDRRTTLRMFSMAIRRAKKAEAAKAA